MAQRISMLSGVAQVSVYGSQKYAVRAQLNPDALAARGIGVDEVREAIAKANVNLPIGVLDGAHRAFTIQATGQFLDAAPYNDIIVAYRNGSPVRLRDLGRAIDSVEDDKTAAWYNDKNERVAVIGAGCPAPARREHGGGGRRDQEVAAEIRVLPAAVGQTGGALRPVGLDQRFDP